MSAPFMMAVMIVQITSLGMAFYFGCRKDYAIAMFLCGVAVTCGTVNIALFLSQ